MDKEQIDERFKLKFSTIQLCGDAYGKDMNIAAAILVLADVVEKANEPTLIYKEKRGPGRPPKKDVE